MGKSEDLNQRLARLALSRQQSWEAVREAQTFVRTGIANFENRPPRWTKPIPALPAEPPPYLAHRSWQKRMTTWFWHSLPLLVGAFLGLLLTDWWGVW
ncbi:hypothetical protein [Gloeomargarita lithophora]|uniref:hypothetical protein n=1 Tax=Gloeomargarita lithophora TaxID=1188228 RepID=UPI0008F895F6|nr:hypothetical protein [Gloeomargarita lithophora]